jgi:hypothetical protein
MAMKSIIKQLFASKIKLCISLFVLSLAGFVLLNTGTVHAGGADCNLVGGGTNGSSWAPAQLTVRFRDGNGNWAAAPINYTLETTDGYPNIANFNGNGIWTGFSTTSVSSRTCDVRDEFGGVTGNFDVWWYSTCGGAGNSCNGTYRGNGWALLCTQHPDGNPSGGSTGVPASFRVVNIQPLPFGGGAGGGMPGQWLGFFGPGPGAGFGVSNGNNTNIEFIWDPIDPPSTPTATTFCEGSTSKVNLSWTGQGDGFGSFWVDISTNSSFSPYSNKYVVFPAMSTVAPDGFTPGMSFSPGTTYYARVYNGLHSGTRSFVAQTCVTPPTVDIRINNSNSPPAINIGGAIQLSWTSTNATSCQSFGGTWGSGASKSVNGSENRTADSSTSGTKSYTIRCTGSGGSATDTVSIVVNTPPSPPPTVTIGATPNPAEVGDPITVSWTVNGSATSCTASNQWAGYNPGTSSGSVVRASDTASPGTITYTITCSNSGGSSTPASVTVNVGYKPYMRVYGGDVIVGGGFGSSCIQNNSAFIAAFAKSNGAGAASQFAVQAPSAVTEFASAAQGASLSNLKRLTFANTSGTYGGNFGGGATCVKDYFAAKPETTTAQASGYAVAGQTIAASTDPAVSKKVIYVDGNARINGNVIFGNDGSWDVSNIPSFYLIVRGNIYIQGSVTRLDGIYIAQPRDDNNDGNPDNRTGYIYTCSNGLQSQYASEGSNHSGYYAACSNALTVNGSFIANRVMFGRTRGTRNSATVANEPSSSTNIAEVFNYSPALWLVNPGTIQSTGTTYDSVGSLPPVL